MVSDDTDEGPIEALRGAPAVSPPPGLEDRIVAQLRAEGRLQGGPWRRRMWRMAGAAAALIVAFALGRVTAAAPAPTPEGFLVLLSGPREEGPPDPASIRAHADWLRGVRAAGFRIDGAPLVAEPVDAPPDVSGPLNGYFLLQAQSRAEADSIVSTMPYTRDGTVRVRQLLRLRP